MPSDPEAISSTSSPNKSLDVLIDLVGSDNVMEDPRFCTQPSNDGLRDADGKLHFGKIHSFFSAGQTPVSSADSGAVRQYTSDGINGRVGRDVHGVESPIVSSFTPLNPGTDDTSISPGTSHLSHSIPDDELFEANHPQAELASFRDPVSSPNETANTSNNHFSLLDAQSPNTHGTIDIISHFPPDSRASSMEPLEAETLTQVLRIANEEITELRRQCDHLRALASEQIGTGNGQLNSPVLRPIYNNSDSNQITGASTRSRLLAKSAEVTITSLSPDIAELSEQKAKQALTYLLRSLSLPLSCLFDATASEVQSNGPHPNSLADIQRALDFVVKIDELIWRRSLHSSIVGGPTAAVFDDENLTAVIERLTLWERVIRGSR